MERPMLRATRETILVRTLVGFRELIVELSMASTTVVSTVVSVVVVCQSARGRHHESQHTRGDQSFRDGHGLSPVELPQNSRPSYIGQFEPHWNVPLSSGSWPAAKPDLPRHFVWILVTLYCPITVDVRIHVVPQDAMRLVAAQSPVPWIVGLA